MFRLCIHRRRPSLAPIRTLDVFLHATSLVLTNLQEYILCEDRTAHGSGGSEKQNNNKIKQTKKPDIAEANRK